MRITIKLKKAKGIEGAREINDFYQALNEFCSEYGIVDNVNTD